MKKIGMMVMVAVVLNTASAWAAKEREVISCPMNKAYGLQITLEKSDEGVEAVILKEKWFTDELGQTITTLRRPNLQMIDYANVRMISQDFGRSGYVFIRLEETEPDEFDGYFDISLFLNQSAINTKGALVSVPCSRIN